jgi:hypothetical protein
MTQIMVSSSVLNMILQIQKNNLSKYAHQVDIFQVECSSKVEIYSF